MNIEQLQEEWEKDCEIDDNYLGEQSTATPKLHAKYVKMLVQIKLKHTKLTSDYNLARKNKFLNYLEIGVFTGENITMVEALHKDGVDPGLEGVVAAQVTYPMTSDNFFEFIKGHDIKYDVIFIDGIKSFDLCFVYRLVD